MNKKISISLVGLVLAIICIVSPKFIATQYQEGLTDFVSEINQSAGYKAELEELDSGWFGSTAKILIIADRNALNLSEFGEGNIELEFLVTSRYGPLLFSNASFIGAYAANVQLVESGLRDNLKWDSQSSFYEVDIAESLFGTLNFNDKIPAFSNLNNDITFSGYEGEGSWGSSLVYEGEIQGIESTQSGSPLVVDEIKLDYYADADLNSFIENISIYESELKITVEKMSAGENFDSKDFLLLLASHVDNSNNTSDFVFNMSSEEFTVDDIKTSDVAFNFELTNLDTTILEQLMLLLETSVENGQQGPDEVSVLKFINNKASNFFAANPELNITELKASLPEGQLNATLHSKLAALNDTVNLAQLMAPQFWLLNAIVNANVEIDKALAEMIGKRVMAMQLNASVDSPQIKQQIEGMLLGLEQQGFIKADDDQYTTEFVLEKGQTKINGNLIPLF